jgi:uncharacterized protein (TIGR02266 family)
MGGKRRKKSRQKTRTTRVESPVAAARALPSPEQAVGAVVESIAALFDVESEEPPLSCSGIHATMPRRGEEHRLHPRVSVAVAIGLETESHFFAGLSGDISEGGVFVQTYRDLPVGSDLEVVFDLPEGQLTTRGRVRWHRANTDSSPPGVGIAFEHLEENDRRTIQRFCEHRAQLYYEVEHA